MSQKKHRFCENFKNVCQVVVCVSNQTVNYEYLLFVMKRGEKLGVGVGGYLLTLDDEESLRKRL